MSTFIGQYDIPFKGLKTGMHHFSFELSQRFFDNFDNPDCKGGAISVDVEMDKKNHLLSILCSFSGSVRVVCDRCLEKFSLAIDFDSNLFVKFGEEGAQVDADVICLELHEHKLNLAEYFFESVCLNLPIKRVHHKDNEGNNMCNREMIKKIDSHRVKNGKKSTDPRWDTLKNIKNKKH